ncbi:MAG: transporter related protein [Acidimicrobiia bacterium]|nr:transporter related protein [Acidimicrobiia bacterium]
MTAVIRTEGLTKLYGDTPAVDSLDLEVQAGDLFGFLGPNGSGKTTTIRMLLALVQPSSGHIELLGEPMPRNAHSALAQVGTLVEGPAFYPAMSGRRNLTLFDAAGAGASRRTRQQRIDEALERVGLSHVGRKPVKAYSLGMRQRLGLASALIRKPKLLVLDEPTNGLDPQGIHEIRALFVELVESGTTVFLSSHLLAEIELICTRAAMLANGRLVAQDSMERLLAPTGRLLVDTLDPFEAESVIRSLVDQATVERVGDHLLVSVNGMPPEQLNAALVGAGVRVRELVRQRRTLEDAFLGLTGDSGDAAR